MATVKKRKYSQFQESTEMLEISPSFTSIERDNFCWKCHKINTNWHCSTCIRTFHNHCIGRTNQLPINAFWQCFECVANSKKSKEMEKDADECLSDVHELNRLLALVYYELMNEDLRETFDRIDRNEWELIEMKMRDEKYHTSLEFMNDLKWIKHRYLSNNDESSDFMDDLIKQCCLEFKLMEMCTECYNNAHKNPYRYFVKMCKSKHKPVWAKLNGFPYWPAKVMNVKKVRNKILSYDVQFFGTHEISESVPFENIKKYSIKEPNIELNAKEQKDLNDCMPEWNEYIKNYKADPESVMVDSSVQIKSETTSPSEIDPLRSFVSYIENVREENERLKIDLDRTQVERNESQTRIQLLETEKQIMEAALDEFRNKNKELSSKVQKYSGLFKGFEELIQSHRKNE